MSFSVSVRMITAIISLKLIHFCYLKGNKIKIDTHTQREREKERDHAAAGLLPRTPTTVRAGPV